MAGTRHTYSELALASGTDFPQVLLAVTFTTALGDGLNMKTRNSEKENKLNPKLAEGITTIRAEMNKKRENQQNQKIKIDTFSYIKKKKRYK